MCVLTVDIAVEASHRQVKVKVNVESENEREKGKAARKKAGRKRRYGGAH